MSDIENYERYISPEEKTAINTSDAEEEFWDGIGQANLDVKLDEPSLFEMTDRMTAVEIAEAK
jgi:hypothetical protein